LINVLKKTKVLKIYICQRIFTGESKIKVLNQDKDNESQADEFLDDEFFYFRDPNNFRNFS
jgi:hypothetical protein